MFQAPWNFDYRRILLDEVALEGLDGIGFEALWSRLRHRMSSEINDKMKEQFWKVLAGCRGCVTFYALPEPAPEVTVLDRFTITDEKGDLLEPPEPIDGPYTYNPIPNEFGSCQFYNERKAIPTCEVASLSYTEAMSKWGIHLVAVASEEERWMVLSPHVSRNSWDGLKAHQYCLLELIGRSRENGVMTMGNTNVNKIVKDAKYLFYLRQTLQSLKLITSTPFSQKVSGRMCACNLLRLARFTKPKLVTLPKHGMVYSLMTKLKSTPNQCDSTANIQKYLNMNAKALKKFLSRQDNTKFFKIKESPGPSTKRTQHTLHLEVHSSESASETEEHEPPVKPQHRVGVGMLRQAYQTITKMGQGGITLLQLANILNVDYYTSRAILRLLVRTKVIRLNLEDKGRQRIGRYISIASFPGSRSEYARVKDKLLQYLNETPKVSNASSTAKNAENASKPDDPAWDPKNAITEIREFDNVRSTKPYSEALAPNAGKQPSIRQLTIAKAIIEIVREKQVVNGTQELNKMVHKATGVDLLDSKTLKRTLARLIQDNQLHYYKLKWPGSSPQCTILICAPHITVDHSIIKTNYWDICLRAYRSPHALKSEKSTKPNIDTLTRDHYYPKYLRARKLHEFLFSIVYGEDAVKDDSLPNGCFNLVSVIPEMTVDLALGHTSAKTWECMELATDKRFLSVKVKEAPDHVCTVLLSSSSLILTVKRNLQTLAAFGLVQMCDEWCQLCDGATLVSKAVYYLNRNAKIVNTTGKWPIPDRKCTENKYYFGKSSDVCEYWEQLYNISINTLILNPKNEQRPVVPPLNVCKPEEAASLDRGDHIPGDGRGAGGLDNTFHVEIPRLWSSAYVKTAGVKRKLVDLQKLHPRPRIPRKRPRLSRTETVKVKVVRKKKTKKILSNVADVKERPSGRPKKRNRIMSLLKWSTLEDKIIVWTRVAKSIMSPTVVPGALQIANFVARDVIMRVAAEPKTASVCHSRALSLERDMSVLNHEQKLVAELRQHRPAIIKKYDGLCRKLRIKHLGRFNKYLEEGELRMMELVWAIANLPISDMYDQSVPCVATDLDDLEERFTIKFSKRNRLVKPYATVDDIRVDTIKEAIIQTVNILMNESPKMEQSMKIFNIFNNYPESLLKMALEDVRKLGAVVHKEKSSNIKKLTAKEAISYSSTFKISVAYIRRWHNMYSANFPGKVVNALQAMAPTDDIEPSSQIACVLLELSVNGHIEILLTKKPSVKTLGGLCEPDIALADVDERVSVRMQRGKIGWRLLNDTVDQIKDIYDDIALTNEVACLCSKSLYVPPVNYESTYMESSIVKCLDEKRELGATFQHLLEVTGMTPELLQDNLKKLEIRNIVKKIGCSSRTIVLWKYLEPWFLKLQHDQIIPAPWITFEKTLKPSSFIGWCGAVAQKVIDYPGISIAKIAELCEFLSPGHVEDICNFLLSFGCVHMKRIIVNEPGLFSDDDAEITMDDCYEYAAPESILVFPVCDSLIRYSLVKKKLSEYEP